jgi:hypothetical protein
MKTHLKSKIALLLISGFLFSCKGSDHRNSNPANGSQMTSDSTNTTTKDNYNTDGTTVAPGASNTKSGSNAGSNTVDPTTIGPAATNSGTTGSGTTEGGVPRSNTVKTDSTNTNKK